MCGRYVSPDQAAMERVWQIGARNWPAWIRRRFNVAPTSTVPILVLDGTGALQVLPARWGLIPAWWKKATPPSLTFNARSEEAAAKPTWRDSLRHHRCLMPAEGWYEWNEGEPVRSPTGRQVHQPYFIHGPDRPVIAFAGLWATWTAPSGDTVVSCALLSREASPAIHAIHHRMPVVLAPDQHVEWLNPATGATAVAAIIDHAQEDLVGHRVSLRVNSPRNDSIDLMDEIERPTTLLDD